MDANRVDKALEQEIERAMSVDPSPEFLAVVRRRIAREAMSSSWGGRWPWMLAATSVVALMVTLVIGWQAGRPRSLTLPDARPMAVAPAGDDPATVQASENVAKSPEATARDVARRVPRRQSPPQLLIVDRNEVDALRRVIRDLPQGVPGAEVLGDVPTLNTAIRLPEITVAPMVQISAITIEPLGFASSSEGGRQ
jgi:hypothetical protein